MPERQPKQEPFKACPYWSRVAIRDDGLVMAYCSAEEAKQQEEEGSQWEGPPKSSPCSLGFIERTAEEKPAVIIYNPKSGHLGAFKIAPEKLTKSVWDELVFAFNQYSFKNNFYFRVFLNKKLRDLQK